MAIKAYPLNNTLYSADDAQLMQLPITSGVYGQKGNFDITLNNNMTATISKGLAFFRIDTAKGFTVYMDTASTATISAASTANPRIDRIVLRWKSSTNSVTLTVIKGTAAASPTAPALSRTATQFDICLYDILVDKNVTKIENYAVTDQRLNDSVCGLLANHAYKIDTSNLQARINALIASQATEIQDITDDKVADAVAARTFFPTKGTDYWTQEDQELMVNGVLNNYTNIADTAPYVFRKTNNGTAVGEYETLKKIVGASIVWNQLVRNGDFSDGTTRWYSRQSGGLSIANGEAILELKVASTNNGLYQEVSGSIKAGHKYLIRAKLYTDANSSIQRVRMGLSTSYAFDAYQNVNITTSKTEYAAVLSLEASSNRLLFLPMGDSYTIGDKLYVDDVTLVDLTPTSSAIADRAYTLEQSTAGSGVAWLKSYGFFTKPYYAYTASPSLQSVKTSAHETIAYNQFDADTIMAARGFVQQSDGSWYSSNGRNNTGTAWTNDVGYKGQINLVMTVKSSSTSQRGATFQYNYTDGTNNKAYYTMSTSYANNSLLSTSGKVVKSISITYGTQNIETWFKDICISLCWDGERAGEYEAYVKHSYPLDSTKTLNGILKLDANNEIYYDGDTYASDGTVTRNYGTRAYQSGDESLTDAITDGTNTVYKLSTPTTETADPFVETQECSPSGTERFIDAKYEAGERDFELPVGHETKYAEPIAS